MKIMTTNKNNKAVIIDTDRLILKGHIYGIPVYAGKFLQAGLGPAQCDMKTGVILVDHSIFKYNKEMLNKHLFILHEAGHILLHTKDEAKCDNFAIKEYAKNGGDIKKSPARTFAVQAFNSLCWGALRGDELATEIGGFGGFKNPSDPHATKFRKEVMIECLNIVKEYNLR